MTQEVRLLRKLLKYHFPREDFRLRLRRPRDYVCSGDTVFISCRMCVLGEVKKTLEQNTVDCSIGVWKCILSKSDNAPVASIYDIDTGKYVMGDSTMLDFIVIKPFL